MSSICLIRLFHALISQYDRSAYLGRYLILTHRLNIKCSRQNLQIFNKLSFKHAVLVHCAKFKKVSHENLALKACLAVLSLSEEERELSMKSFLIFLFLSSAEAGCRWHSPAWKQSLASAPEVNISAERIVTVRWGLAQLEERAECVDRFEVGVRNMAGREERKLCSLPAQPGLKEFHCKLDLSNSKYCGNKFGFWVTAVNINHNRGVERLQTFANTLLEVRCGSSSTRPEKVRSS